MRNGGLMELRILGHQLAVTDDSGTPTKISRYQVRGLLCILAVEAATTKTGAAGAGSTVSTSSLVERLWEPTGTIDPVQSLQQAVHNARRCVPRDRLVTEPGGYRLRLDDADYLDLREFRDLTDKARTIRDHDPVQAVSLHQQALALWGRPPLGDLPQTTGMAPIRQQLIGEQFDAREELAEALLELIRHPAVVDAATHWLAEDPLNEHLRGLVMLALARAGRKGEALRLYQDAVTLLATTPSTGRRPRRCSGRSQELPRSPSRTARS
ncbi:hypothetical protein GCM10010411_75950 [Actinomadura fulvescens]|uniref:Bacterial transcriptional activator domain-containing protein n=1 Tax=Actinomadura fulvescens TaxID=46160 RepID=A0ABP6CXN5_9ACTN